MSWFIVSTADTILLWGQQCNSKEGRLLFHAIYESSVLPCRATRNLPFLSVIVYICCTAFDIAFLATFTGFWEGVTLTPLWDEHILLFAIAVSGIIRSCIYLYSYVQRETLCHFCTLVLVEFRVIAPQVKFELSLSLTLKVVNFWKFPTYCSLKPLWSGMGEVVPARTSPTLHSPSPPTVHQLSWLAL